MHKQCEKLKISADHLENENNKQAEAIQSFGKEKAALERKVARLEEIECAAHLRRDLQKVYDHTRHMWARVAEQLISDQIHRRKELCDDQNVFGNLCQKRHEQN